MGAELNDYKGRLGTTSQESEAYKIKLQKLLNENSSLGEEVRSAQQNLRLSTGQIGRLTAEYKAMVVQSEQTKKKIQELETQNKRLNAEGENKIAILSQECQRLNALV